jgi:hypothetical protein
LLAEFVMVSISPVPKLDPGPVSYCQLPDGGLPAGPLKSSLKIVDHPGGGAGRAGEAVSRAAAEAATGAPPARGEPPARDAGACAAAADPARAAPVPGLARPVCTADPAWAAGTMASANADPRMSRPRLPGRNESLTSAASVP